MATRSYRHLAIIAVWFGSLHPSSAQELKQDAGYPAAAASTDNQVLDFPRDNPAVTIISDDAQQIGSSAAVTEQGRPNFWDKIFEHGSPLHFGLTVGEAYDDNIFISRPKIGDFYTYITPLVEFKRGDQDATNANFLDIVFHPTFFLYDRESQTDRTDYYADLLYQHRWQRLVVSVEQRFEKLTDPNIDVGNLFNEEIYLTRIAADYDYNGKLSFGGSETQQLSYITDQPPITETGEWITDLYARYQISPKISLALGPRIGVVDITGAPNQTYQQALVRLAYQMTDRIAIKFEGGGEYRQYQDGPNRLYPVFAGNATWTPTDGTKIALSASRENVISYGLAGQNYLATQIAASVRQRVYGDFFILLSGGYTLDQYEEAGDAATVSGRRLDRYYFASAGLEWDPKEWMSVSLRGQTSADDSNFTDSSFNDRIVNIQSTLQF